MKKIIFAWLLASFWGFAAGQELNCTVQILTPGLQGTDMKVFETLKTSMMEFMNNTRWTTDKFKENEKIECSILVTIKERPATDQFGAHFQIQCRRPVYKSSYSTTLINFLDEFCAFRYVEFDPIYFVENTHTSQISSLLAFYAYLVIGLDYSTFGEKAGDPYFLKAQNILNNAQQGGDKGWRAFDGNKTRYWLIENLFNPQIAPIKNILYHYHIHGLDVMAEDVVKGRAKIREQMVEMKKVNLQRPNTLLMQVFFAAKSDELVSIFSESFSDEKGIMVNLLKEIDPGNANKYSKLQK